MKALASAWISCRPGLDSCIPCLLESPRTGQNVAEVVVPFVASVLIEVLVAPRHGEGHGPGRRPDRWIGDRKLVDQRVVVHALEALDERQVLVGRPSDAGS